jgi:REP element-mobilizing transposase RayT
MTNHIHLILSTKENGDDLSNIIRDFKKHTSREITSAVQNRNESSKEWMLEAMNKEAKRIGRPTNYKLWKEDNHAIYLDDQGTAIQDCLEYIHDNPVVNGLVSNAWEYLYSSAMDYEINKKGLVNIEFI